MVDKQKSAGLDNSSHFTELRMHEICIYTQIVKIGMRQDYRLHKM